MVYFINNSLGISDYRHLSICFMRKYINYHKLSLDPYFAMQAGHSAETGANCYAVCIDNINMSADNQEHFANASKEWHLFLNCRDEKLEMDDTASKKEITPLESLQKLFEKKAVFRGSQEKIIKKVLTKCDDHLIVLGTGAGKTLLHLIPTLLDINRTSILVLPLVSLIESQTNFFKSKCIN